MKPNNLLKSEGLHLLLLAVPFLVLIPLWDKFPQVVPIHWGLDGKPNGWADKSWGLLLLPVLNVGLAALMAVLLKFDRRVRSYSPETQISLQNVLKRMGLAIGTFITAQALLVDATALGWKFDVVFVVNFGALVLLAVLGNYMPKLRPNRFVGIRTPWTLKSPEVWTRTHRLFGRIMLIGSLVLIPFCFLLPTTWVSFLLGSFVTFIAFGAMIYSYACYRSQPPGT